VSDQAAYDAAIARASPPILTGRNRPYLAGIASPPGKMKFLPRALRRRDV